MQGRDYFDLTDLEDYNINDMTNALEMKLQNIPLKSGIYLFKDERGEVLYVGKAVSLNQRVKSYFQQRAELSEKIRRMLSRVHDIDYILALTEQEALVLESNFIKRYRPRYNVRLKDDKSYPYLKLDLREDYPVFSIVRRPQQDGARYFGPFTSASSLKITMNLIKKLFPIRTCTRIITEGKKSRPCLDLYINRCQGPCTGAVSREEYMKVIKQVLLFLEGKTDTILRDLKQSMEKASGQLEFERAAKIRDQIAAIEKVIAQQKLSSTTLGEDTDVIALARDRDQAFVQVFFIRNGALMGKEHFILIGVEGEEDLRVLSSFIKQFYGVAAHIPDKVLIPHGAEEEDLLRKWLKERKGMEVRLKEPRSRKEKNLIAMAEENAREGMEQYRMKQLSSPDSLTAALSELAEKLRLPAVPHRIECYDVSNIQGASATASMVVFEEGLPVKSDYRRFRIKDVKGPDDYAMLREALMRRLKRKGSGNGRWSVLPELLVVDGGKGQLNTALQVIKELGLADSGGLQAAALAKEREEIFRPGIPEPIVLPPRSPALYLIQRVRDEAHRFALGYHTKLRSKQSFASVLDNIPGLGRLKKKALLKAFRSVKGIETASVQELLTVPGIHKKLAERIKEAVS